jgi:hypothetical protein
MLLGGTTFLVSLLNLKGNLLTKQASKNSIV